MNTKTLTLTDEQRTKISIISTMFDDFIESMGDDYMQLSEYVGHSILDVREMLDKLYFFEVEIDEKNTEQIPSQQIQTIDEQEWINNGCPKINRDIIREQDGYFIFGNSEYTKD